MTVTPAEYRAHRGQLRPGTKTLSDVVRFLMGGSVTDGGIVNDRNVRGGSSKSLHAVGRAADFMVHTGQGPGRQGKSAKEIGDELFVRLIAAAPAIGAEEIIWWRQIWSPSKGLRAYTGLASHKDHVHVGISQAVADNRSPDLPKWFAGAIFGT